MNNYKIKVNNEAESEEVSVIASKIDLNVVGLGIEKRPNGFMWVYLSKNRTHDYSSTKEITLAELRDMVVLKRNDVGDATHQDKDDAELKYRLINNQWHVITDSSQVWRKSSVTLEESQLFVKPIEKTMKEYLDSKRNYEFVLSTEKEEGFIEIPEGAEVATASGLAVYFWKPSENKTFIDNVGWSECDAKSICTLDSYLEDSDVSTIWQRPTQPEALPFIDDEPQSLNDQYSTTVKSYTDNIHVSSKVYTFKELDNIPADMVNHPEHYTQGKVECIDALEAATVGKAGIEAVCVANVIKYLWRYEEKNGKEDVKKAQWYLNKLLDSID